MNDALPLDDLWFPMDRHTKPLTVHTEPSEQANAIAARFDYTTEQTAFYPWVMPTVPESFSVGAIVGGSGTGKTTLARTLGDLSLPVWDESKPIIDHLGDDADELFYAVGLSSVPAWMKPFHVLSNGEQFRANLARQLHDGAVIDEFTSVVDRTVAKSASRALGKFTKSGRVSNIVVSTVHRDVLPWLEPDWVIDTDAGMWANRPRECLCRGPLVADVYQVHRSVWPHFMGHHYLSGDLNPFAACYLAVVEGRAAAFCATVTFPVGTIPNARRETRLVTMPDFQGLGIGPRLSDWVAELYSTAGHPYYGRTVHPRLGQWRDNSPEWAHTSKHMLKRDDLKLRFTGNREWNPNDRLSFSHKWVGTA